MHYYDGKVPEPIARLALAARSFHRSGPPPKSCRFWLFSTQSDVTGTKEMNEISLAIKTPLGLALMVGCSHPGIEKILEAATKIEPRVYSVFGIPPRRRHGRGSERIVTRSATMEIRARCGRALHRGVAFSDSTGCSGRSSIGRGGAVIALPR